MSYSFRLVPHPDVTESEEILLLRSMVSPVGASDPGSPRMVDRPPGRGRRRRREHDEDGGAFLRGRHRRRRRCAAPRARRRRTSAARPRENEPQTEEGNVDRRCKIAEGSVSLSPDAVVVAALRSIPGWQSRGRIGRRRRPRCSWPRSSRRRRRRRRRPRCRRASGGGDGGGESCARSRRRSRRHLQIGKDKEVES